eukprot:7445372-Alexandrium_andersonii.AAC.1
MPGSSSTESTGAEGSAAAGRSRYAQGPPNWPLGCPWPGCPAPSAPTSRVKGIGSKDGVAG